MPKVMNMKPVRADAALAAVVGAEPIARTEIMKVIWKYIKAHSLQDATNRRMINADDKLLAVFDGRTQISMFELAGAIGLHTSRLEA